MKFGKAKWAFCYKKKKKERKSASIWQTLRVKRWPYDICILAFGHKCEYNMKGHIHWQFDKLNSETFPTIHLINEDKRESH